jgi:hypothetical protein
LIFASSDIGAMQAKKKPSQKWLGFFAFTPKRDACVHYLEITRTISKHLLE